MSSIANGRPSEVLNGEHIAYAHGEYLFHHNQMAQHLYYVRKGTIKLQMAGQRNDNKCLISLRKEGSLVGAEEALLTLPYLADSTAVGRSEVFRISVAAFKDGLGATPEIAAWAINLLSRQSLENIRRSADISLTQGLDRLLDYLHSAVASTGLAANIRVVPPLSNKDLASLLAITPEHLSRLLHLLISKGLVVRRGGWLIVTDLIQLEKQIESR
jgi:CRP-like cAMP-binding protein